VSIDLGDITVEIRFIKKHHHEHWRGYMSQVIPDDGQPVAVAASWTDVDNQPTTDVTSQVLTTDSPQLFAIVDNGDGTGTVGPQTPAVLGSGNVWFTGADPDNGAAIQTAPLGLQVVASGATSGVVTVTNDPNTGPVAPPAPSVTPVDPTPTPIPDPVPQPTPAPPSDF
jgi:hypothetical protein